jgi:hypothetical protein
MLTAEYTNGTSKISPMLWLTKLENGRREYVQGYSVNNKREARKLAADFGAKCWNF